ncbi:MAG: DUF1501 domain-containing protein [Planctomycetes bacterium]|nr:DUF1501 domain-containing protein [Planctomycetota bacterium]
MPAKPCAGPVSRRSFLEIGAIGATGLGLSDLLRLRAEAGTPTVADDTAVIFIWLPGGFPHMDTYDMKPEAPAEYRGEFKPVKTNVPGIEVTELFPLHTKVADRFSLIRSISHDFAGHDGGHKRVMTGRIPKSPAGFVNDAPAGPSIVARMREHVPSGLPHNILLADSGRTGVDVFSFGSAYMGPSYNPFEIPGDPSDKAFQVKNLAVANGMATRLADRRSLLEGVDRLRRDVDRSGAMTAMDRFNVKAYDLLTSEAARNAFDLSQESAKVRERYGNHSWGQRTLMARRLIEAGSSFVSVVLENPTPGQPLPFGTVYNWDCHAVNCHIFTDTRFRAPYYDQTITALIEDLYNRGLDKRVLVVATGEFGHTPRIEYQVGTATGVKQPGRDHWPRAMSMLVSGGGLRMGQVVGSTNAKGEDPKDRPLTPNDLWATIYRHLGIDSTHTFLDHSGRPNSILPFGSPIRELI